jgi:hypothetical protein
MNISILPTTSRRLRLGYFVVALCLGWLFASPARAGLNLHVELDHNADAYYLCFPTLSTNSNTANPLDTGYFAWSHTSSINSGTSAGLDADGNASCILISV